VQGKRNLTEANGGSFQLQKKREINRLLTELYYKKGLTPWQYAEMPDDLYCPKSRMHCVMRGCFKNA